MAVFYHVLSGYSLVTCSWTLYSPRYSVAKYNYEYLEPWVHSPIRFYGVLLRQVNNFTFIRKSKQRRVTSKIIVFWDVKPGSLVGMYKLVSSDQRRSQQVSPKRWYLATGLARWAYQKTTIPY
jgi:hypothetical protein